MDAVPSQTAAAAHPAIPPEWFERSVVFIATDGQPSMGAEAVFRSLACAPGGGVWWWLYRHAPWFAGVSEWAYRRVAARRRFFG